MSEEDDCIINETVPNANGLGLPATQRDLPAWRRPVISRIEIKRTLFTPGSGVDATGGTN